MKREIRVFPFDQLEVREEGESPQIVGHAAVFDKLSEPIMGMFVETVRKGAFKRALKEKQDVRALINHDDNFVLGRTKSGTLSLSEDDTGLLAKVDPPDTGFANDLMKSIRRGDIDQMSFGFRVVKETFTDGGGPDGMELRELLDVDLFDVSPVAFPAYPDTDVAVRSYKRWMDSNAHDQKRSLSRLYKLRVELSRRKMA